MPSQEHEHGRGGCAELRGSFTLHGSLGWYKENPGPQTYGLKNHKSVEISVSPSIVHCFPNCGPRSPGGPQDDSMNLEVIEVVYGYRITFLFCIFQFPFNFPVIPRRKA